MRNQPTRPISWYYFALPSEINNLDWLASLMWNYGPHLRIMRRELIPV